MDKTIEKGRQVVPLENRAASVFVHVTDLRRAAEWYSRLLGLPIMEERLNGGPVYWFDFPGTHLILDNNGGNRESPEWRESMLPRVMFPASDIDEAYRYIQEKAEPFFEPERHGSMAFFNFRDPEGSAHMVCWTEHPGPDWEDQKTESPVLARIGGVFVDVKDMAAAARWYSGLLGVPLDEKAAAESVYSVPVTRGAALLLDQNRFLKQETYTVPFYFETKDWNAALDYVRRQGLALAVEPEIFENGAMFVVQDPDGNRIMVAQMN
ncbi:VOC family protein [Cohnella pontilimi]|uniref:VOC family protein n=1 Tax=Cohnella pontilimi TaxID=2564100 RepID=UPI00145F4512|nr:VOC family protein [Cohnella pontilimi]